MRRLFPILLLALSLLTMSCSQNNGHIGPIYGAWSLTEMKADGQPLTIEGEGTVFSFQSEVIQITLHQNVHGDYIKIFGNFSLDGTTLTLKFAPGVSGDEGYQYTAPSWLYFPEDGKPIDFHIAELGARQLIIDRTSAEGKKFEYIFKKTW